MFLKILKYLILILACLSIILVAGLYFTNNAYILKAIQVTYLTGHKTAFIDDYMYFDNRKINIGTPQPWPRSADYNSVKSTEKLDAIHKNTGTIAYLIIKNDSIWYEKYYDGYSDSSKTNSFSMAKSIVSACLGKAIELGYIESLDDLVVHYLPELKGKYAKELTIRHLVSMRSGLSWNENYYVPFNITTRAYFDPNLSEIMLNLSIDTKPGQAFNYKSGDTQLLAILMSSVLPVSLTHFMSTYFWQPMGAEHPALWQFNKTDKVEKAYCCIASNARDFARFGKLYLHLGNWNGKQLLPQDYVEQSIKPAAENSPDYGYGWWLGTYKGKNTATMNGHLGQYVITIPEDNLIIVRLGHSKDKRSVKDPESSFYQFIEQAYIMLGKS
ncbi:serine hydrolase domain-containing protein [Sphingobacterium sp. Mn56C]|uniref:serine hydrolase domain-containing protein n=1 Tax=Sphingobacterium sp. Mn56C TaxID=3395261 RepID=UPI003BBD2871